MTGFDAATVTAQGLNSDRHDEREVGTFSGHPSGHSLATTGDSRTAMDTGELVLPPVVVACAARRSR